MNDRMIYNYHLVMRLRRTLLWTSINIIILILGLYFAIVSNKNILWGKLLVIISIYYVFYLFWGIMYIFFFKCKLKISFPYIPWYGIYPKNMLTIQKYKKFELSYLILICLFSGSIILFIPDSFQIFLFSFTLTLFLFRAYLFLSLVRFKNDNVWIKYEDYGISAYKTD